MLLVSPPISGIPLAIFLDEVAFSMELTPVEASSVFVTISVNVGSFSLELTIFERAVVFVAFLKSIDEVPGTFVFFAVVTSDVALA